MSENSSFAKLAGLCIFPPILHYSFQNLLYILATFYILMELGKRFLTLFVLLFFCVSSASAACGNSVSTSAKSTCPKLTSSVSPCALKAPCGACVPKITGTVAGKKVSLTGSSTGATAFYWNFGDKTISRAQNPVHTYKKAGTYKVCLSVKCGNVWLSSKCKTVKV